MKIDSYRVRKTNISSVPYFEQRMGTLIIWFAALILLEGVLRKWLLTPIEQPLLFIREPVLLLIYYYYAKDFGIKKAWFLPYIVFSIFIVFLSLVQAIYWEYPPLVPLLGIRFYILYIPLAFIMGEVLNQHQLVRLIRFLLWTSIPIAILVILQFLSPVQSPINKGLTDSTEGRFIVVENIVRPYGPFTFVSPQSIWAALILAIVIISWEKLKQYSIPIWLISMATGATLVMGALSGSRTYFVTAILIMLFYVIAGLTSPNIANGVKRLFYVVGFVASFLIVFIFAFPTAYESMSQRQEQAVAVEGSTIGRAIDGLTDVTKPFNDVPMFGYGIGAGSNAGTAARGAEGLSLGETEWARMINEIGGVFGYPVVLLRTLFVICLAWLAFIANRKTGDGAGLIFFGFVSTILLMGQITMQNQILAIAWFSVGLLMALLKTEIAKVKSYV